MNLSDWVVVLNNVNALPTIITELTDHESRLKQLELRMATAENTLAALDAVTNALADDAASIRTKLEALQAAISSGNQAAVTAAMDTLAPDISKLQATETTLRGLGADPANPVPAPAPPAPTA